MNIQQVNQSIMFGAFTNEQLNSVMSAVKYAKAQMSRQNVSQLRVGDNVNFVDRNGRNSTGVVMKIAIKYVTVRTISDLWKVPANMLTLVAEEC
jgi:hypothetical protein